MFELALAAELLDRLRWVRRVAQEFAGLDGVQGLLRVQVLSGGPEEHSLPPRLGIEPVNRRGLGPLRHTGSSPPRPGTKIASTGAAPNSLWKASISHNVRYSR
jgi:hypothetical protein